MSSDIGVIGLSTMGRNLALNIASRRPLQVAVYNRSPARVDEAQTAATAQNLTLHGHRTLAAYVKSLKRPRTSILLVKAGKPVDDLIQEILPLLESGDILIDGGNELYTETERRQAHCAQKHIRYVGMGVSGGEEGARYGPSLMPGGDESAFKSVSHILSQIAADVGGEKCVTYIGPGGSGNFVKMVHNGIEYGDMQLISEAYDILRRIGGLQNAALANVFSEWNSTELQSYLIEITAKIFLKKDDTMPTHYLVDLIRDVAGAKGTGKWTMQEAFDRGVPCPTIGAAVDARSLSGLIATRTAGCDTFGKQLQLTGNTKVEPTQLIEDVKHALYCSKICSYAQGFMLMQVVSQEKGYNLDLANIAKIWRGGCIIRARFLDTIAVAYTTNPKLPLICMDPTLAKQLLHYYPAWKRVVRYATDAGVPVSAISSSLCYFNAICANKLPTNLIQAQRDYFGAHTFERIDRPGTAVHAQWTV
eukprot:Lankesteria_metandrocarpae@DN4285_c2_g1_i1.p1